MKLTQARSVQVTTAIACDACGFEADANSMDAQEFLSYSAIGGYGSVFGDCSQINVDLCQHCVKSRLGDVLKIVRIDVAANDKT
jgi:hypothetical protein